MLGRGTSGGGSSERVEQLFAALQARVTLPVRESRFDSARARIANAAFLPSRVWKDTSVWNDSVLSRKSLRVQGALLDGRYYLAATVAARDPRRLAESLHVIALTRLGDGEYAWDTQVDYAVGSVAAEQLSAFVVALLTGAEGHGEPAIREETGRAAPRASAVLAQLFHVDSIKTAHFDDRSTLATFFATLTPAGVKARYPHYARYLERYGLTSRMRWTLTDASGAVFFECSLRDGRMMMRLRSSARRLVSLSDAARRLPDSLTLHGDFAMKVRRFTVGFQRYQASFIIDRSERERGWTIVSRTEPDWELPLFAESLLRTPLRRPFEGPGASFRIGVRDTPGAQTILGRTLHLEVKESAILRFIGRLGAMALADYSGEAEREQYAWLKELFDGVIADIGGADRGPENQNAADP